MKEFFLQYWVSFQHWANNIFEFVKSQNPILLAIDFLISAFLLWLFLAQILKKKDQRLFFGLVILLIIFLVAKIFDWFFFLWLANSLKIVFGLVVALIFLDEIKEFLNTLVGAIIRERRARQKILESLKKLAQKGYSAQIAIEKAKDLTRLTKLGLSLIHI